MGQRRTHDRWERPLAALGTLVALVVAVQQGRPLSVLALAATGAAACGVLAWRWRRTRPRLALALPAAVLAGGIGAVVVPASRTVLVYDVAGIPRAASAPVLALPPQLGMEIAQAPGHYLLRVPVTGIDQHAAQLATVTVRLRLGSIRQPPPCGDGAGIATYTLSDAIQLYPVTRGSADLAGQVREADDTTLRITGTVGHNCGDIEALTFTFAPQLPLHDYAARIIEIGIPTRLHTTAHYTDRASHAALEALDLPLASTPDPIQPGTFLIIRLDGRANDGHLLLTACGSIAGHNVPAGDQPHC